MLPGITYADSTALTVRKQGSSLRRQGLKTNSQLKELSRQNKPPTQPAGAMSEGEDAEQNMLWVEEKKTWLCTLRLVPYQAKWEVRRHWRRNKCLTVGSDGEQEIARSVHSPESYLCWDGTLRCIFCSTIFGQWPNSSDIIP